MAICGTGSGGYFKNKWYAISKFASDLQLEIDTDRHGTKVAGSALPKYRFSPATYTKLQSLQQLIELSGLIAMEIEILYSEGQGETNFNMLADGLLNKYTNSVEEKNKENK